MRTAVLSLVLLIMALPPPVAADFACDGDHHAADGSFVTNGPSSVPIPALPFFCYDGLVEDFNDYDQFLFTPAPPALPDLGLAHPYVTVGSYNKCLDVEVLEVAVPGEPPTLPTLLWSGQLCAGMSATVELTSLVGAPVKVSFTNGRDAVYWFTAGYPDRHDLALS